MADHVGGLDSEENNPFSYQTFVKRKTVMNDNEFIDENNENSSDRGKAKSVYQGISVLRRSQRETKIINGRVRSQWNCMGHGMPYVVALWCLWAVG